MPEQDLLAVELGAVPGLRRTFASALMALDRQIELVKAEIRVTPWAADPVSAEAAEAVNALSSEVEGAALEALLAFREQLDAAVENLAKTEEQYAGLEEDNAATVTHTPGGGA
ncbi:transcriptional regulator [Actinokineospora soli]|uniref:Transcriptional regulator n=1 Tax=Actinokineospora soli TaxID=1048753 RepID=A0ABW2TWC2_9PSEU